MGYGGCIRGRNLRSLLAAQATKNMNAAIEPGFYFFTAYCLFSILSTYLVTRRVY